jgi:hypothetical protein
MNITIEQIITEVRNLAKQWPDNVYKKPPQDGPFQGMCSYDKGICEPSGGIGCIFGQAFRNLGVELKGSSDIYEILSHYDISSTGIQKNWCLQVQNQQDLLFPWGKCVEWADNK